MKPWRNNLLTTVVALGLLVATTGRLQAQGDPIPLTVTIQATAIVQGPETYNAPNLSIPTSTVKITTKDILNLVNAYYHITTGSKLVLYEGDVWVVNSSNSYLYDLTLDDILGLESLGEVWQVKANTTTCKVSETWSGISEMVFNDFYGNAFLVEGSLQDKISSSAEDTYDNLKVSESLTATGAGYGTIGGTNACLSGTVKASGKAAGSASTYCPL